MGICTAFPITTGFYHLELLTRIELTTKTAANGSNTHYLFFRVPFRVTFHLVIRIILKITYLYIAPIIDEAQVIIQDIFSLSEIIHDLPKLFILYVCMFPV